MLLLIILRRQMKHDIWTPLMFHKMAPAILKALVEGKIEQHFVEIHRNNCFFKYVSILHMKWSYLFKSSMLII